MADESKYWFYQMEERTEKKMLLRVNYEIVAVTINDRFTVKVKSSPSILYLDDVTQGDLNSKPFLKNVRNQLFELAKVSPVVAPFKTKLNDWLCFDCDTLYYSEEWGPTKKVAFDLYAHRRNQPIIIEYRGWGRYDADLWVTIGVCLTTRPP